MSQIYPPIIEGNLPAFYEENEQIKITVPFSMNRAVSPSEVVGMSLKIKTVQTGTYLHEVTTKTARDFIITDDEVYAIFYLTSDKLRVGQFYKLQIAYIIQEPKDKKVTSQYSSAGVAKFTTKPAISIQGYEPKILNTFQTSFIGCYEQQDSTEKVYSYIFNVYGPDKTLYWSTGTQLHNSSNDSSATYTEDTYLLNKEIIAEKIHYIQYSVTTINGLTGKSPLYKMIRRASIECGLNVSIKPELNFDNGYIVIYLDNTEEAGLVTGAFSLLKSSDKSDYSSWDTIFNFTLHNEKAPEFLYQDFIIEHGVRYRYAIIQHNDTGLYSEKIYSDEILADFEDSFLYDGNQQLKLRFNTKISKFSSTHLEAKTDTIGGKYPVIFRNGYVGYKEFQIAALISYYMDEEYLFISLNELNTDDITTDYTVDNIHKEQLFKNKVLEWLNDGKPKLFRSPQEGMFIVRLIKVSMTPEQKLGRLLHNFSATAYEIAEVNYDNLLSYGFLQIANNKTVEISQFKEIDLGSQTKDWFKWDEKNLRSKNLIADYNSIYSLSLTGMLSGDKMTVVYNNGQEEDIIIGPFGSYYLESKEGIIELYLYPRMTKVENLGAYKNELGEQFTQKFLDNLDIDEEELKNIQQYLKNNAKNNLSSTKYAQGYYFLQDNETGEMRPAKEILGDKAFNISNIIKLNENTLGYNLYEMSNSMDGVISFNYTTRFIPKFTISGYEVNNMTYPNCCIAQFTGATDIYSTIMSMEPKYKLDKFYKIILRPRPIETTYDNPNETIYFDNHGSTELDKILSASKNDMHSQAMYYPVQNSADETGEHRYEYIPMSNNIINHRFRINNETMYIEKETEIILKDYDTITLLSIGDGLIADVYWQYREYEYACESSNKELINIMNEIDELKEDNVDYDYYIKKQEYMIDYIDTLKRVLGEE